MMGFSQLFVDCGQVDVLSVTDKDGHISVHWAILPAPSSNNVTVAVAEVSCIACHS